MNHESGSHLTTSRISRVFRPLRTKCKHFVEVANLPAYPHETAIATYGTSSRHSLHTRGSRSELSSLILLPPPKALGALTRLEKPARDRIQLSKAIYDIRDAYRNVVQVAFGIPGGTGGSGSEQAMPKSRVQSLASACACVIGEQVEEEARTVREEQLEPDEAVDMELLDSIYEAVPMHYRRYTLVAHALSFVLEACPHHPSLLYLLLDVSLSHDLGRQSRTSLRRLLEVALEPQAITALPSITCSAHSTFLATVFDMCSRHCICERSFASMLVAAISAVPQRSRPEVWTCKAFQEFAERILSTDIAAFTLFIDGLIEACTTVQASSTVVAGEDASRGPVLERLATWLEKLCQRVFNMTSTDSMSEGELEMVAHLISSVVERHPPGQNGSEPLIDIALCMATLILSASRPEAGDNVSSLVVSILRTTPPRPSTFSRLIDLASGPEVRLPFQESSLSSSFSAAVSTCRGWAASLRARRCFAHEASLWSAASSHLEGFYSATNTIPSTRELEPLRRELTILVEKAEERSFGGALIVDGPSVVTPRKDPRTVPWYRWDDTFEVWVPKTPAAPSPVTLGAHTQRLQPATEGHPAKRRRTDMGPPARQSTYSQPQPAPGSYTASNRANFMAESGHASSSSSPAAASSLAPSLISTPPLARAWLSVAQAGDGEDEITDVNIHASPTPSSRRPVRRVTIGPCEDIAEARHPKSAPFRTMLADALKNRIVLHTGSTPRKGASNWYPPQPHTPAHGFDQAPSSPISAMDPLSSDDALDLFAQMSSEV